MGSASSISPEKQNFQLSNNYVNVNKYTYRQINRKEILFYKTTVSNAEKIISSQKIKPNKTDYQFGDVIYLTNKIDKMTNYQNKNDVYHVVEVNSPKTYLFNKYLMQNGITAIISSKNNSLDSLFYVLDLKIVKIIKFAYGKRPYSIFSIIQEKIVLFLLHRKKNHKK